jgi:hypothetical protein
LPATRTARPFCTTVVEVGSLVMLASIALF